MKRENSTSQADSIASRWQLPALLVLTCLVRGLFLLADQDSLADDPDNYQILARQLRQHGVYATLTAADGTPLPTAFRPPLYPLLLAAVSGTGGPTAATIAGTHLLLGLISVALLWHLGQNWTASRRTATFACLLLIVDPILLNQSSRAMTETLATLLALAVLAALTGYHRRPAPGRAFGCGVVLGLACLCRPTFLLWGVLTAAVIAGGNHGRVCSSRRMQAAMLILGLVLTLTPWAVRNQSVLGRPIYATTHGGYTLLLANNPQFYDHLRFARWGEVWDARELQENMPPGPGGELAGDRHAYELARHTIRQQPGMFLYSTVARLGMLWSPLPHQLSSDETLAGRLARYAVGVWYVALYGFALSGAWMLGRQLVRPPWLYGLLLIVSLSAVHAVYWSNMRMRAPLMPCIALLAAVAMAASVERNAAPGDSRCAMRNKCDSLP